jgi:hypothetical protein
MEQYSYYFPTETEEEENEVHSLMQDVFWSFTRLHLYKEICKGKGGSTQWAFITGKKSRDKLGKRIQLTDKNISILQRTVDYFNTEEGIEELLNLGITTPPDHIDDLVSIIADSPTREQTKKEEFKMFLKYRERIFKFLSRI